MEDYCAQVYLFDWYCKYRLIQIGHGATMEIAVVLETNDICIH